MQLKRPPVIEAWIGFRFEPRPGSPTKTVPEIAVKLMAPLAEVYPKREWERTHEVTFENSSPDELPKPVSHKLDVVKMRSYNVAGTRCIQLTKEQLVYSVIKTSVPYPGFSVLRDEALEQLARYVQDIDPLQVRACAVFYKDLVDIPANKGRIEDLSDYFKYVTDFDVRPFGDAVSFNLRYVFECPTDTGPLIHSLQPIPGDAAAGHVSFEMTWLKICDKVESLDAGQIRARLDSAHSYLRECFRSSVTDTTWALFEPADD